MDYFAITKEQLTKTLGLISAQNVDLLGTIHELQNLPHITIEEPIPEAVPNVVESEALNE